jgi:hypothetical protein
MRTNRVMRDQIAEARGPGVIDEIVRWNDGALDSLGDYGVPVSLTEEQLQADVLELMAISDSVEEIVDAYTYR